MNNSQFDEELIKSFLQMLASDRVKLDHFWLDIGKALYNTFEGSNKGIELWTKFTNLYDTAKGKECYKLYPEFSSNNYLSYKTLAWYAREDSPDTFNIGHTKWVNDALESSLSCEHSDIAEALYRCYFLEFVSGTTANLKLVYQYKNNKWNKIDNGYMISSYLTSDFLEKFYKMRVSISTEIMDACEDHIKDACEYKIKRIGKLITKLKSKYFGNTILLKSLEKFYVDKIHKIKFYIYKFRIKFLFIIYNK